MQLRRIYGIVESNMKAFDIKGVFPAIFKSQVGAVIVVDIGASLKLLDVSLGAEPKVRAIKIVELPFENRDSVILASLRSFIHENNISHKTVVLKPAVKLLFAKRIEMPPIPQAELREAIKLKLKPDAPFDLQAAALDFSVVGQVLKKDGSKALDVLCVAVPEQDIKEQVLLLKQLGLVCVSASFLPWGYAEIIKRYMQQENSQPIGVIDMQADRSYVCVYRDNKFTFYRELPITVNKLKESLSGTLVTEAGKVQLSAEEIGKALFQQGIPAEGSQILAMLRPDLERLGQEIKRSFAYYDAQFQGGVVGRVLIGGLAARIPNIDKFLSAECALNFQRMSLLGIDKDIASPGIDPQALSESYASFGLAIGWKDGINLLPYEFRTEKIERFQMASLRWVAFIAFLLLAVSYIFAKAKVSAYQKNLDNARLQLNVLSEIKDIKTRTEELNKFIYGVRDSDLPVAVILQTISTITDKDLFFEACSFDSTAKAISIDGFVKSADKDSDTVLTKFASNMEKSPYFKEATISSVQKSGSTEPALTKFHLTAKLQ